MTNAMVLWERGDLYNIPELQNNVVAIVRTLALTTKRVRDLWFLALFAYREPNNPRRQVLQRLAADRFSVMPYWTRHNFIDRLRTMASSEVFLAIDTAVNFNLRQETLETRTLGPLMKMIPVQKYYVDVPRNAGAWFRKSRLWTGEIDIAKAFSMVGGWLVGAIEFQIKGGNAIPPCRYTLLVKSFSFWTAEYW